MSDYRVRFRRGDTGAVVDRRVQAGSSSAARAAVEARGHTVLEIGDAGGVALADESDHAPAHQHPAALAGGEVVALLRSIDERLGRVERSRIVRSPSHTIGWAVVGAFVVWVIFAAVALALLQVVAINAGAR